MIGIVSVQVEAYSSRSIGGRLSRFVAGGNSRLIAGEGRRIVIRIECQDKRQAVTFFEEISGLLLPWLARSQFDAGVMAGATAAAADPRPVVVAGNVKHVNCPVSAVGLEFGVGFLGEIKDELLKVVIRSWLAMV